MILSKFTLRTDNIRGWEVEYIESLNDIIDSLTVHGVTCEKHCDTCFFGHKNVKGSKEGGCELGDNEYLNYYDIADVIIEYKRIRTLLVKTISEGS